MKRSSFHRWLFEAINLLMVLALTVPLSILLALGFHYEMPWIPWLLCLSALGYLAGRLTMRSPAALAQAACFGTAVLVAAANWLLLSRFGAAAGFGGELAYMAVGCVCCIAFFFCARKAGYAIYTPMALVGILLHVATLLTLSLLHAPEWLSRIASAAAIVYVLLSMYAFNARGLRSSVHSSDASRSVRLPNGIQRSSFLLVSAFILLTVIVSAAAPVIPFFGALVLRLVGGIIHAFGWLIGLADRLGNPASRAPQIQETPKENMSLFDDAGGGGEAEWVGVMVEVVAIIIVAALGIVLLVLWYQKLKGFKFFKGLFDKIHGLFNPETEEDYIDETESLFSWKDAFHSAAERLRGMAKKVTERPQKFDDFHDDRLKIRFVFQQLLKRQQQNASGGGSPLYQTPNELQTQLPDKAGRFIAAYNRVRYAGDAPDAEEVALAKSLLPRK